MLPQKVLKINVLRLAENVFPSFQTHQFVNKMLKISSNRGNWCCLTRIYNLPGDFGDVP